MRYSYGTDASKHQSKQRRRKKPRVTEQLPVKARAPLNGAKGVGALQTEPHVAATRSRWCHPRLPIPNRATTLVGLKPLQASPHRHVSPTVSVDVRWAETTSTMPTETPTNERMFCGCSSTLNSSNSFIHFIPSSFFLRTYTSQIILCSGPRVKP